MKEFSKKNVKDECERITQIAHKYENCYEELYQQKCKEVVRETYGTGGEMLHRGYLCPSLIDDIVVGKIKRGRMAKKKPTMRKEYHTYGFDEEDNLIIVQMGNVKEFIVKENGVEIGIIFSKELGFRGITECIYINEKIVSYGYYSYNINKKCIDDFRKEIYTYKDDSLQVDWYDFSDDKVPILGYEEYNFNITDGYLSTYTVKEHKIDNELEKIVPVDIVKSFEAMQEKFGTYEVQSYKVYKKRKV